ncbi:MAG: hypothetical protein AB1546_09205, partial [bacterium]
MRIYRHRNVLFPLFLITLIAITFLYSPEANAITYQKYSSNQIDCDGNPLNDTTADITFEPTDAGQGIATEVPTIEGTNFCIGETISAATDSILLDCGGTPVGSSHAAITVEDDGNGIGVFASTTITFDKTAVDAILPSVSTNPIWCDMTIEDSGGNIWTIPDAYRFDRQAPDVDTTDNVITYPLVPMPGGAAKWSWLYTDSTTPADPDGECSTSACNKTDERFRLEFFSRREDLSYDTSATPSVSISPDATSFIDPNSLTTQDRDESGADAYCYAMRVKDSAGNISSLAITDGAGINDEKCLIPDGKSPQITKVEYFKDANFTEQFPYDATN